MLVKLNEPILLQSDSDSAFMIAVSIEIQHEIASSQITYHGKVYGYENSEVEFSHNGYWVYDLNENVRLSKDNPFE